MRAQVEQLLRAWLNSRNMAPLEARTSSGLALYVVLEALARGNLLRFGIATVLRGPAVVLRAEDRPRERSIRA